MRDTNNTRTQQAYKLEQAVKNMYVQLDGMRVELRKLNGLSDLKKWYDLKASERNLLADIDLCKKKIYNLTHGMPANGYGDPMPGGRFTRGIID